MKLLALFSRLLSILAVGGLLIAPIVASRAEAAALAMPQGAMNEVHSMSMSMSMPDGMPCCPEQGPLAPDHQKSCPFAIACMMGAATIAPVVATSVLVLTEGQVIALLSDPERNVLASAPPLRPPRA